MRQRPKTGKTRSTGQYGGKGVYPNRSYQETEKEYGKTPQKLLKKEKEPGCHGGKPKKRSKKRRHVTHQVEHASTSNKKDKLIGAILANIRHVTRIRNHNIPPLSSEIFPMSMYESTPKRRQSNRKLKLKHRKKLAHSHIERNIPTEGTTGDIAVESETTKPVSSINKRHITSCAKSYDSSDKRPMQFESISFGQLRPNKSEVTTHVGRKVSVSAKKSCQSKLFPDNTCRPTSSADARNDSSSGAKISSKSCCLSSSNSGTTKLRHEQSKSVSDNESSKKCKKMVNCNSRTVGKDEQMSISTSTTKSNTINSAASHIKTKLESDHCYLSGRRISSKSVHAVLEKATGHGHKAEDVKTKNPKPDEAKTTSPDVQVCIVDKCRITIDPVTQFESPAMPYEFKKSRTSKKDKTVSESSIGKCYRRTPVGTIKNKIQNEEAKSATNFRHFSTRTGHNCTPLSIHRQRESERHASKNSSKPLPSSNERLKENTHPASTEKVMVTSVDSVHVLSMEDVSEASTESNPILQSTAPQNETRAEGVQNNPELMCSSSISLEENNGEHSVFTENVILAPTDHLHVTLASTTNVSSDSSTTHNPVSQNSDKEIEIGEDVAKSNSEFKCGSSASLVSLEENNNVHPVSTEKGNVDSKDNVHVIRASSTDVTSGSSINHSPLSHNLDTEIAIGEEVAKNNSEYKCSSNESMEVNNKTHNVSAKITSTDMIDCVNVIQSMEQVNMSESSTNENLMSRTTDTESETSGGRSTKQLNENDVSHPVPSKYAATGFVDDVNAIPSFDIVSNTSSDISIHSTCSGSRLSGAFSIAGTSSSFSDRLSALSFSDVDN